MNGILIILLVIVASPFLIYVWSKIQMRGWIKAWEQYFFKQRNNKSKTNDDEKETI